MKRLLVLTALALLALPAAAQAKELSSITFCGAGGCRTIDKPPKAFADGGDGVPDPAPSVSGFYTVRLTAEHEGESSSWQIFFVPGADMLGLRDENGRAAFDAIEGEPLTLFRKAVRGLRPYGAPRIVHVSVDGKTVDDPGSYAGLFSTPSDRPVQLGDADWVPITLVSKPPSPWASREYLFFSPSTGILQRGAEFVQLPRDTAAAIRAGASLAAPTGGGSGFDWPLVSSALAAALAVAGTAALLARRHRPTAA